MRFTGGKSEHHTAACRVKHAGVTVEKLRRRRVSQKKYRRFFGNKVQVRVKRRGKSSPLAKQFVRHEKPHAVQDKTEEGQPARLILGYRRIAANESSSDSWRNPGEINDHPQYFASKVLGQNSAYRHQKYEGRFRKRRRPSLLQFERGERALTPVANFRQQKA